MRRTKEPLGEERETINGKPYLGIYRYVAMVFNGYTSKESVLTNPNVVDVINTFRKIPLDLENRHETFIFREPYYAGCLIEDATFLMQNSTFAIKGLLWGRAFKVMKACKKKGNNRLKKVYRCGKRKRVKACHAIRNS